MPVDKKMLMENLAYALKAVLLENLDGLDLHAMELNIDRFMEQDVAPMGEEDIIAAFYTPEDSMRRFMAFLENSGALDDIGDEVIH
jgi:hypothetical protein